MTSLLGGHDAHAAGFLEVVGMHTRDGVEHDQDPVIAFACAMLRR
jgi:hypothetical protein